MKSLTTVSAWSVAGGSGAGAGAVATHRPERTKTRVAESGAHTGMSYVPSASLVRPDPSGRTSYRPVSLPSRISLVADQLMLVPGSELMVRPVRVAITPPYTTRVPSGDQPSNVVAHPPPHRFVALPDATATMERASATWKIACAPSGAMETAVPSGVGA